MSDPVSNAEIEDVLSSIRRLISEGGENEAVSTPEVEDMGKLVLTPDFRVHEDEAEQVEPPAEASAQERSVLELVHPIHTPEEAEASVEEDTAGDPEGEAEAQAPEAVEDTSDDANDQGDDAHEDVQDASADENDTDEAEEDQPTDLHIVEDVEAESADVTDTAEDGDVTLSAEALEDAISATDEAWEPDGGEDALQAEMLMFHAARQRKAQQDQASDAEGDDGDAQEQPMAWEDSTPLATSKDSQATYEAFADELTADVFGASDDDIQTDARDPDEIVGDDTDIVDEEVLREMVSRLVREELKGEVGEKITVSIRRLVRREIERAITLKSLD